MMLISFQIIIELSAIKYRMYISFAIILLVLVITYKKLRRSILYDKLKVILERRK